MWLICTNIRYEIFNSNLSFVWLALIAVVKATIHANSVIEITLPSCAVQQIPSQYVGGTFFNAKVEKPYTLKTWYGSFTLLALPWDWVLIGQRVLPIGAIVGTYVHG